MYEENDSSNWRRFLDSKKKRVKVIDGLNISVHEGEILAIVGASGSGKTILADSIMGIFEPNALVTGEIWFDGKRQTAESIQALRGHDIAFVPQSVAALDPLMKVGKQVRGTATDSEGIARQKELFEHYGLSPEVEQMYPHQLSGGMARRVLLCCALMACPKLLIADEPTPGMDLELAVRAMDDLRQLADDGVGIMLITHDVELALRVADRLAIFKDGSIVEETSVRSFELGELESDYALRLRNALPEYGFAC